METTPPQSGIFREYWADGSIKMLSQFKNGKRNGLCTTYFQKSRKLWAKGKFKDGKFSGPWFWNRKTGGLLQKGKFVNGLQHGLWKRYQANGKLWDVGSWNMGKKTGVWKVYDTKGRVKRVKKYH